MTTIQDRRPSSYRRPARDRALSAARLAVRVAGGLATATVFVALAVAGFGGWGTPTSVGGWTVAAWAVGGAILAGVLRAVLGSDPYRGRGDHVDVLVVTFLAWVCAAVLTFSLSYFFHAHALDDHATLRVSATVTDCVEDSDAGNSCTYHWVVGGHTYSSQDGAAQKWPDGHRVTVRIDPAHPERPAQVSRSYWVAWIGILIGLVGTPFAALIRWSLGTGLD
ncbi:DUF3592 domain-containing protein [Streptacidiphilus fuscans]|uniref:DUF3592 domain-containing protein n=1 Tax=Streptacidiphilus fuscans TaxID=2789292 RepID=A0A931B3V2_9ACTN|nr:DUF3592 domain-containing protein [Streptacidiphilus fuscans]MBF9067448.1 DUF3592 domain-containing protein [Streptacidiphilus fuscans]